jgi:hypothetical protein
VADFYLIVVANKGAGKGCIPALMDSRRTVCYTFSPVRSKRSRRRSERGAESLSRNFCEPVLVKGVTERRNPFLQEILIWLIMTQGNFHALASLSHAPKRR